MSCKGCAYAAQLSGAWCCDYLQITGHCRPCPPGEGCTVRKEADLTKKGSAYMKRREWDTEEARTLYDEKLSDAEIAGRVGTTASAVAYWRRSLGLPANPERRPPPAPEAPAPQCAAPGFSSPAPGASGHERSNRAVGGAGRSRLRPAGPGPGGRGANLRIRRAAAGGRETGCRQAEGGDRKWLRRKHPGCAPASTATSAATVTAARTAWSGSGTAAGIPVSTIRSAAAWKTGGQNHEG